jgi:hypothetical protein
MSDQDQPGVDTGTDVRRANAENIRELHRADELIGQLRAEMAIKDLQIAAHVRDFRALVALRDAQVREAFDAGWCACEDPNVEYERRIRDGSRCPTRHPPARIDTGGWEMSYSYAKERPALFTDLGVDTLIRTYGAVVAQSSEFFRTQDVLTSGDTWTMLAALDYLQERGMIRLIQKGTTGQRDVWERLRRQL